MHLQLQLRQYFHYFPIVRGRFNSLRQRLHQFVSSSIVSQNIYIRNEVRYQMVSSLHQLQLLFIELFAFRQFHRLIAHNLIERISTTSKTCNRFGARASRIPRQQIVFFHFSFPPFPFLTSPFSPAFCDFDC